MPPDDDRVDDDVGRTASARSSSATARAKPRAPSGVDAPSGMTNGRRPARAASRPPRSIAGARAVARRDVADLGAEQRDRAARSRVGRRRRAAPFSDEHARAVPRRAAAAAVDARVIRLHAAARDERVGAGGDAPRPPPAASCGPCCRRTPNDITSSRLTSSRRAAAERARAAASAPRPASAAGASGTTAAASARQGVAMRHPVTILAADARCAATPASACRPRRRSIVGRAAAAARGARRRGRAWTPGSTRITPCEGLTRGGTFVFLTDSAVGAAGRRQPAASRHQSRQRRAARPRRAVPDDQALAASTAWPTPTAPGSTGSSRSSCSAATRASGRRAASSTPGSCASRSASTCPD